jgi:hypothetical protein
MSRQEKPDGETDFRCSLKSAAVLLELQTGETVRKMLDEIGGGKHEQRKETY